MAKNVNPIQAEPKGVVPLYIGYPGAQHTLNGAPKDLFREDMEKRFQLAYIRPITQTIAKDANIYEDDGGGWGKYKTELENVGITLDKGLSENINVVLNTIVPITEQYSTQYGDSEIFNLMAQPYGQTVSDLATLAGVRKLIGEEGGNSKESLTGLLKDTPILGTVADGAEALYGAAKTGAKALGGASEVLGNVANMALDRFNSPASKIGWPQLWRNSNFNSAYELTTRLYCYNCTNDEQYKNNILASLAALQLFTIPRSQDGVLYEWPFMCELVVPGAVWIPMGYMSNLQVIKGGDVSDFSMTGRPNIIDVRFTIQNVYGVCVTGPKDIEKKYKQRPTLRKELKALYSGKNLDIPSPHLNTSSTPPPSDSKKENVEINATGTTQNPATGRGRFELFEQAEARAALDGS